jgi:hypothetical protein
LCFEQPACTWMCRVCVCVENHAPYTYTPPAGGHSADSTNTMRNLSALYQRPGNYSAGIGRPLPA